MMKGWKHIFQVFFRWLLRGFLALVGLFLVLWLLIQLPAVQTWLVNKAGHALVGDVPVAFEIEKVDIRFVKSIVLKGVYLEDVQGDTLLYTKELDVDISLFSLWKKKLLIDELRLHEALIDIHPDPQTAQPNYQFLMDLFPANAEAEGPQTPTPWEWALSRIHLQKIRFRYREEEPAQAINLLLGELDIAISELDLQNKKIDLQRFELSNSQLDYRQTLPEPDIPAKDTSDLLASSFPYAGWDLFIKKISLSENQFSYREGEAMVEKNRFQPRNFWVKDFALLAKNIEWEKERLYLHLEQLSFREGDAFRLEKGELEGSLSREQLQLKKLLFRTAQSTLSLEGDFQYPGLKDLYSFSRALNGRLFSAGTSIDPAELAYFVPQLALEGEQPPLFSLYMDLKKEGGMLQLDSLSGTGGDWLDIKLKGKVPFDLYEEKSDLFVEKMAFNVPRIRRLLRNTLSLPPELDQLGRVDLATHFQFVRDSLWFESLSIHSEGSLEGVVRGELSGLGSSGVPNASIYIEGLSFDPRLLNSSLGLSLFPDVNDTPLIKIGGELKTQSDLYSWTGKVSTPKGKLEGTFFYLPKDSLDRPAYRGAFSLNVQDLSDWADEAASLGKLTGNFRFQGAGTSQEDLTFQLDSRLDTLEAAGYPYQRLGLDARWADQSLLAILKSEDPHAGLNGRVELDLRDSLPLLSAELNLDSLDIYRLGLYPTPLSIHTKLVLHTKGISPEKLTGKAVLRDLNIANDSSSYRSDSLYVSLEHPQKGAKELVVESDLLRGNVKGIFEFSKLGRAIEQYFYHFDILAPTTAYQPDTAALPVQQLEWTFSFPTTTQVFRLLTPVVEDLSPFELSGKFHSEEEELILTGSLPVFQFQGNRIEALKIKLDGTSGRFRQEISCKTWVQGQDTLFSALDLNGKLLEKSLQMEVNASNLLGGDSLKTLTTIEMESLSEKALIRGATKVYKWPFPEKLLDSMRFSAKLPYQQDKPGEIELLLQSGENRISGNSRYDLLSQEFNGRIQFQPFSFASLAPFTGESLSDLQGICTGELKVSGTLAQPELSGLLTLEKTGFRLPATQISYMLETGLLSFSPDKISWKNWVLKEDKGGRMNLNGEIRHTYFSNFFLDLSYSTAGFQIFRFPQKPDAPFYGQLQAGSSGVVRGRLNKLAVEVELNTQSPSSLTVLPMSEEEAVLQEPFITFGKPVKGERGGWKKQEEVERQPSSFDLDLLLNLGITPDFFLNVLLDAEGGDRFNCRGEGNLVVESDAIGNVGISGDYLIKEGQYFFSYEGLVKKEFSLQEGSRIRFSGDPYDASFDITAIYEVNTPTYPLLKGELSLSDAELEEAQRPVPVQLLLRISGNVREPALEFDIEIPEEQGGPIQSVLNRKLNALKERPSEWNKQVFSLLLFNSFMGKSESSSVNSFSDAVESSIYSSINSLVTQQLNKLAGKYLKGVELSFGMDSYTTSGQEAERVTEMEVQLSKQLFNDRLKVSVGGNVDVGGNRGAGPESYRTLAGDFVLEYKLNKRGNYLLRVYHLNDYNLIQDETNYKTGLGIMFRKSLPGRKKKGKNRK
jgi:hypothetical protein